jgi:NAD(P)-dependent dehydrogenase (short-subunit alcohol dehydrogenase family)
MENNKVWFVTGASKGLGLSLIKELLTLGYGVAATSREPEELKKEVGEQKQFLPLKMDVKSEESAGGAIRATIDHFGKIDVVVNNAGYGLTGGLEELSDKEARDNFDVNVFGSLNVIRLVMPHLRQQGSGHILNVGSIGGLVGTFPAFGIYCATKFAVHGFTESLAAEVKEFNIRVTLVSPGYFRTNFLSPDSLITPKKEMTEYKSVREVQRTHQFSIDGHQPGDPKKAAQAMIHITGVENPPLHLFLGQDAYDLAHGKIASLTRELEAWKELTTSTAF